jgi:hypothetical protein
MLHQSTGRDRKREPSNSYVPLPEANRALTPDFLYAALDTTACAAFIKESRINFAKRKPAPQEIRVLTND